MMDGISVCIAARNEEMGIADAVQSTASQDYSGELEVLVCANGCTDRTMQIVSNIAFWNRRVRLITSEPGKPNAWNRLMQESRHDLAAFMDADVQMSENALDELEFTLSKNDQLIAVTPSYVRVTHNYGFFSRAVNLPTEIHERESVRGGLYLLHKPRFIAKMKKAGYECMPPGIINDDRWVSLVINNNSETRTCRKHIGHNGYAKLYYIPPKIDEYFSYSMRTFKGIMQLAYEHPHLGMSQEFRRARNALGRNFLEEYKAMEGFEKMIGPLGYIARRAIQLCAFYAARRQYLKDNASNLWAPIISTKRPFKNPTGEKRQN